MLQEPFSLFCIYFILFYFSRSHISNEIKQILQVGVAYGNFP